MFSQRELWVHYVFKFWWKSLIEHPILCAKWLLDPMNIFLDEGIFICVADLLWAFQLARQRFLLSYYVIYFFFGSLRSSRASRRGRRQTFFCDLIYSLSASVALEFLHVQNVFKENRTVVNGSCSFEFSTGKHLSKPGCRV